MLLHDYFAATVICLSVSNLNAQTHHRIHLASCSFCVQSSFYPFLLISPKIVLLDQCFHHSIQQLNYSSLNYLLPPNDQLSIDQLVLNQVYRQGSRCQCHQTLQRLRVAQAVSLSCVFLSLQYAWPFVASYLFSSSSLDNQQHRI